ncbi:MAG TPA: RnfABCDGE type electron transport complex subunit G [Desulfosalsimonadaceae bacterium]|nr:RnfABCDGE type electron transport complex subunit G [Desulfosalsimonadaceae bacterium]
MREMVKMVLVLTILSSFSGGLLAAIRNNTQDRIDSQVLKFVKGPAIQKIMEGASNNPIQDRFALQVEGKEKNFFVGVFDGAPRVIAFETKGSGYGGDVGTMVAVNVKTGRIHGVSVTTHNETPGVGARVETHEDFKNQFRGIEIGTETKVKKDGGGITAMSGATITSRAVCTAVRKAGDLYNKVKPRIREQLSTFSG